MSSQNASEPQANALISRLNLIAEQPLESRAEAFDLLATEFEHELSNSEQ
ncbi:MAG: hypothetical protein KF867_07435 [Cryobacterium sp.]|nr:hypothetical protein [Cryobacterium sp.]